MTRCRDLTVTGPPPEFKKYPLFEEILHSLRPGITLGMVNLPLAVSLSIAGGGTPEMGALSAAWGGLIGGVMSGSHFTLYAPTGGLSSVLSNYVNLYGVNCLPWLAFFVSIISFVVYALNLHYYLTIIPQSAMVGFKLGIGTIIALNQLNFALGLDPKAIPGWVNHEHFYERVAESFRNISYTKAYNPIFFLWNMLLLLLLTKVGSTWPYISRVHKRFPLLKQMPWHIIFVVIGIVYGYSLDSAILEPRAPGASNSLELLLLQDRFTINPYLIGTTVVDAPSNAARKLNEVADSIAAVVNGTATFGTAFFSGATQMDFGGVFMGSLSISLIAILETQIAAKILDGTTNTGPFDSKREVLATAFCNMASFLAGGIPICGAMARMSLNADCGARTRVSMIINGITVMILLLALMPLFKFLPQAVIGAVLVPVAVSMIKVDVIIRFWKTDRACFGIALATFLICVFLDPTYAILAGIFFGLIREARQRGELAPTSAVCAIKLPEGVAIYHPIGEWTFTNSQTHLKRIGELRKTSSVVVTLEDVYSLDLDATDAIGGLVSAPAAVAGNQTQGAVRLSGFRSELEPWLGKFRWVATAKVASLVLNDVAAAVASISSAPTPIKASSTVIAEAAHVQVAVADQLDVV